MSTYDWTKSLKQTQNSFVESTCNNSVNNLIRQVHERSAWIKSFCSDSLSTRHAFADVWHHGLEHASSSKVRVSKPARHGLEGGSATPGPPSDGQVPKTKVGKFWLKKLGGPVCPENVPANSWISRIEQNTNPSMIETTYRSVLRALAYLLTHAKT